MNAYEYLKPGAIVPVTNQAVKDLVELGKQQADRIAELEKGLELVKDAYCVRDSECKELKSRIAELEKDFAWAKDQWNKDRICFESRRNELEKDLVLKTRDRDVFSNFTLAYEKRISELEKELDSADKAYKWMDETYKGTLAKLEQAQSVLKELGWHEINKDGYAKLQTKPLSDEEIISMFEHPDDFNCIDFARAIEERHGIK